jgi:predicted amidohydrolase YtcJ
MAQPGSASALGAEGREFESLCPDQFFRLINRKNNIRYWFFIVFLLARSATADDLKVGDNLGMADLILFGGKILTLDAQSPEAQAIAIRDNEILFAGSDDQAQIYAGPATKMVELGGRTVIPGLIDSHIHAIRAGLTYTDEVGWYDVTSLEEGFALLRERAKTTAPGEWIIVAGGWVKGQMAEGRAPTLQELDAVSSDHPVYIQHQYDLIVLNSAGMRALEIVGDIANPPNGKYERDEDDQLTGRLTGELPFFFGMHAKLPRPTFEQQTAGTKAFMSELNRVGLTGFIDAGGGGLFPQSYRALYKIWQAGELTQRVRYHASVQRRGKEIEDIKAWSSYQYMGHGDEMLRFNGFGEIVIWGMHDGGAIGIRFDGSDEAKTDLYQAAMYLAERETTLRIHAHHDHSAGQILDIFERVNEKFPIGDLRWAIDHGEDLTASTLQRMQNLGMGWGVQDRLYFKGDDYLQIMGRDVARRAPALKTAMETGVVIAAGTDAHRVAPYNPFISLEWLVTGKSISGTDIRGAEQLLSREEALRMYTLGSAWMSFDEEKRGSLEAGKLADLVVLSDDYMAVEEEKISEIVSLLTVVDGRVVYAAPPFAPE